MGMVSPEIDSLSAKFLCWCASLLWKLLWNFVDTIKHYLQPCKGYMPPRSHARLHAAIIISHFWVTRQITPPWSARSHETRLLIRVLSDLDRRVTRHLPGFCSSSPVKCWPPRAPYFTYSLPSHPHHMFNVHVQNLVAEFRQYDSMCGFNQ